MAKKKGRTNPAGKSERKREYIETKQPNNKENRIRIESHNINNHCVI